MNMDRFKFRAWDIKNGKWIDPTKFACPTSGEIMVRGMGTNFYIRSQCTGLKDSEGKLIYESDIVRIKFTDERVTYLSPVMWKYGAWCIYHENRRDYRTGKRACVGFGYWTEEALKGVTVLGNIYEHKHLLEADER